MIRKDEIKNKIFFIKEELLSGSILKRYLKKKIFEYGLKERYDVIDLRKTKNKLFKGDDITGWMEYDDKITASCFICLERYIEDHYGIDELDRLISNTKETDESYKPLNELRDIYYFWTEEINTIINEVNVLEEKLYILNNSKDHEENLLANNISNLIINKKDKLHKDINDNLSKLLIYKSYLWL